MSTDDDDIDDDANDDDDEEEGGYLPHCAFQILLYIAMHDPTIYLSFWLFFLTCIDIYIFIVYI